MAFAFRCQPLIHENNHKQCGHHEIQAGGVERQSPADNASERRSSHPGNLIQQRHEEIEPAAVNIRRYLRAVVDRERLITHGVNQIRFFRPHVLETPQHGQSVKQVPCSHHQRQHKRGERIECGNQQIHRNEFHGTGVDERAHAQRPQERKPAGSHKHSVRHGQKEEADANRQHFGERGFERTRLHSPIPLAHPHSSLPYVASPFATTMPCNHPIV